ncbi:MAG: hypothetical protein ACJ07L_16285 [Opitutales bacterium]
MGAILHKDEWDFSMLDEREISFCYNHELKRETLRFNGHSPLEPFLSKGEETRKKIIETQEQAKKQYPLFTPAWRICDRFEDVASEIPVRMSHEVSLKMDKVDRFRKLKMDPDGIIETFCLSIDWRLDNATIAKKFAEFLKDNRPKQESHGFIAPPGGRGTDGLREMKNWLRHVGASRIWLHCKKT